MWVPLLRQLLRIVPIHKDRQVREATPPKQHVRLHLLRQKQRLRCIIMFVVPASENPSDVKPQQRGQDRRPRKLVTDQEGESESGREREGVPRTASTQADSVLRLGHSSNKCQE
jgi:hypothetical protein